MKTIDTAISEARRAAQAESHWACLRNDNNDDRKTKERTIGSAEKNSNVGSKLEPSAKTDTTSTELDSLTKAVQELRIMVSRQQPPNNTPRAPGVPRPRQRRPLSEIECFNCRQKGHYSNDCPEPSTKKTMLAQVEYHNQLDSLEAETFIGSVLLTEEDFHEFAPPDQYFSFATMKPNAGRIQKRLEGPSSKKRLMPMLPTPLRSGQMSRLTKAAVRDPRQSPNVASGPATGFVPPVPQADLSEPMIRPTEMSPKALEELIERSYGNGDIEMKSADEEEEDRRKPKNKIVSVEIPKTQSTTQRRSPRLTRDEKENPRQRKRSEKVDKIKK
ncbi:hypothetical protein BGW38_009043, partial [Lunasporangiospora selenospora]